MGLLESHANQSLSINITRALSPDEWAILLQVSLNHKVNLTCFIEPSIILPKGLATLLAIHTSQQPTFTPNPQTRLIQSTDPDTTIAQLTKESDDWQIIDVSELSASNLLHNIYPLRMMEELMNDLLMDKTPEKERPNHPGFMIIGTQNPSTMAGQKAAGNALARRHITVKLPDYSEDEMHEILTKSGVSLEKTDKLVSVYLQLDPS